MAYKTKLCKQLGKSNSVINKWLIAHQKTLSSAERLLCSVQSTNNPNTLPKRKPKPLNPMKNSINDLKGLLIALPTDHGNCYKTIFIREKVIKPNPAWSNWIFFILIHKKNYRIWKVIDFKLKSNYGPGMKWSGFLINPKTQQGKWDTFVRVEYEVKVGKHIIFLVSFVLNLISG